MSMADVWWMENGQELADDLTRERDEARAEVGRLRALCDRVREAWAEHDERDHGCDDGAACSHQQTLRAAIEALGPGGP